jgi:hypothetical protein
MDAKLTAQAERLARELATQTSTIDDLNSLFKAMMKSALECILDTEMETHLGRRPLPFPPDTPERPTPPGAPVLRDKGLAPSWSSRPILARPIFPSP